MIVGVGIDVCDIGRFAAAMTRTPGLGRRLFTPAELPRGMSSLAARFAAKEAVAKALGAPGGLSWQDAEVLTDSGGRPTLTVRGTVAERARVLGVSGWHLSLSHDAGIASALVIAEGWGAPSQGSRSGLGPPFGPPDEAR
ncbi:MAG: holo-ACP synthase [Sporichthyaceae bacterium]